MRDRKATFNTMLMQVKQEIVSQVKAEYSHAIQVYSTTASKQAKLQASGHAQCAALLLDKFEGPDPSRNKKLVEIMQEMI
jgi:hypothetical protein